VPFRAKRLDSLEETPERLFVLRWGENVVRMQLVPDSGGCMLILSECFDDSSTAARNSAGWQLCLRGLALAFEGAPLPPFSMAEWSAPFERLKAKFEPLAGPQVGAPESFTGPTEGDQ